jgi:hypothetical protein
MVIIRILFNYLRQFYFFKITKNSNPINVVIPRFLNWIVTLILWILSFTIKNNLKAQTPKKKSVVEANKEKAKVIGKQNKGKELESKLSKKPNTKNVKTLQTKTSKIKEDVQLKSATNSNKAKKEKLGTKPNKKTKEIDKKNNTKNNIPAQTTNTKKPKNTNDIRNLQPKKENVAKQIKNISKGKNGKVVDEKNRKNSAPLYAKAKKTAIRISENNIEKNKTSTKIAADKKNKNLQNADTVKRKSSTGVGKKVLKISKPEASKIKKETAVPMKQEAELQVDSIRNVLALVEAFGENIAPIKKDTMLELSIMDTLKGMDSIVALKQLDTLEKPQTISAPTNNTVFTDSEMAIAQKQLLKNSEDILALFSEEDYQQVLELGTKYLVQQPTDTVIIIKTGLSAIFSNQYPIGFELIDKTVVEKNSLLKLYASLPFIYSAAKEGKVQHEITTHCFDLDSTNIWSKYAATNYSLQTNDLKSALHFAKSLHNNINTRELANELAYVYPFVLHENNWKDSAILELEKTANLFPDADNVQLLLIQHYKQNNKLEDAYNLSTQLNKMQPNNEEYLEARINICIQLKKMDEACSLLSASNSEYHNDEQIYKIGCDTAFYSVPFKNGIIYNFKINKGGNLYFTTIRVEPLIDNSVALHYSTILKEKLEGKALLAYEDYDTSSNLNFSFVTKSTNENKTASSLLWLSKASFGKLKNYQQVELNLGNGIGLFTLVNPEFFTDTEDQNLFMDRIEIDGNRKKFVHTLHLYNLETAEQLWVLDDEKNPLVVKMDGAFTMELNSITTQ